MVEPRRRAGRSRVGGLGGVTVQGAWIDVDFSSVALTVGDTYTLPLLDAGSRWGVQTLNSSFTGFSGNPYAGGQVYMDGVATPSLDMRFRVLPVAGPAQVPEPSSLALVGLAVMGLRAARSTRRA